MGGVRENCVLRTPKGTAFENTFKEDEVLKSSSQVIEVIVSQEVEVKGNVDLTVELWSSCYVPTHVAGNNVQIIAGLPLDLCQHVQHQQYHQ